MAMQDYTLLASSLADSYYVLSCSSSPLDKPLEDSLRNTFIIPFLDVYLFAFLLVLPYTVYSMVHTCFFHTFASLSVSLDLVWQPGSD